MLDIKKIRPCPICDGNHGIQNHFNIEEIFNYLQDFPPSLREVKAAREMLSMTQSQLAKKAYISISTLRDFESGKRKLNKITMNNLVAIIYGMGYALVRPLYGKNDISGLIPNEYCKIHNAQSIYLYEGNVFNKKILASKFYWQHTVRELKLNLKSESLDDHIGTGLVGGVGLNCYLTGDEPDIFEEIYLHIKAIPGMLNCADQLNKILNELNEKSKSQIGLPRFNEAKRSLNRLMDELNIIMKICSHEDYKTVKK